MFEHAAAGETALLSYCIVAELPPISESLAETTKEVMGGFSSAGPEHRSAEHARACEGILEIQTTIESVLALLESFATDGALRRQRTSQSAA